MIVVSVVSVPLELAGFISEVTARIWELAGGLFAPLREPVAALAARPGKGLRPLLLRACAGPGTGDRPRLARLGAVAELLHLASLLHDDLIDQAATRRGAPAAHAVIGPERAMLAGLACLALAGMESAELGGGADRLVSESAAALSYGELLDVERAFDTGLALPDYVELVERKTGELFRLCCALGAAEAGSSPEAVRAAGEFGRCFGIAFQILDDCLDFAAEPGGKPRGTDHQLGLFGAPTLYALAADQSGELAGLLLSRRFGPGDMDAVRVLVTAHGGLAAAERLARTYYTRALSGLDGMPDPAVRHLVTGVAAAAWRDRAC